MLWISIRTEEDYGGGVFGCRFHGFTTVALSLVIQSFVSANNYDLFGDRLRDTSSRVEWISVVKWKFLADESPLRPPESLPIAARPGIAAHVIAAFLPKSGLILGEKADAPDPLRRFPGVKLRDD